jgi:hypothetical protein
MYFEKSDEDVNFVFFSHQECDVRNSDIPKNSSMHPRTVLISFQHSAIQSHPSIHFTFQLQRRTRIKACGHRLESSDAVSEIWRGCKVTHFASQEGDPAEVGYSEKLVEAPQTASMQLQDHAV